jgi:hypothetical protein
MGMQAFMEAAAAAEAFDMLDVNQRGKVSQHVRPYLPSVRI